MELECPPDAPLAALGLREGDSPRDRAAAHSHPGQALRRRANARLGRSDVSRGENRRAPDLQSRSPGEVDGRQKEKGAVAAALCRRSYANRAPRPQRKESRYNPIISRTYFTGGLPKDKTVSLYFFRSNFAPSRALACSRNARCSVTPTKYVESCDELSRARFHFATASPSC